MFRPPTPSLPAPLLSIILDRLDGSDMDCNWDPRRKDFQRKRFAKKRFEGSASCGPLQKGVGLSGGHTVLREPGCNCFLRTVFGIGYFGALVRMLFEMMEISSHDSH